MRMREIINLVEGYDQATMTKMAQQWADQYEDGHEASGPATRFEWTFDPNWNLDRTIDGMPPEDRIDWMKEEIDMWAEEGEEDRFDYMLTEPIYDPVTAVEINGNAYLWDGNHRVGACLLTDRHTIPAIVGRIKPSAGARMGGAV